MNAFGVNLSYSLHERVICQQLALKYCNLRLDHAIDIQLTTASEGKVLRQIREGFRVRRIFQRPHEDKQRG